MTLGDRRFRWRVSFHHALEIHSAAYAKRGSSWLPDRLLIRPADDPGRLLTICWPACCGPPVGPKLVRAGINEAIRRGWPDGLAALTLPGHEIAQS